MNKKNLCLVFIFCLCLFLSGEGNAQSQSQASANNITPCLPHYVGEVVSLTNSYRQSMGLQPLQWNSALAQAASNHAWWMANAQVLSHADARGLRVRDRAAQAGYAEFFPVVAENIANGHNSPEKVMAAWRASSSHNMAMLLPEVREIGVACFINPQGHYKLWWAQVFAVKVL